MGLIRLEVHPENPQSRAISQAAAILRSGGIAIYPTDTVYGMGACVSCAQTIDRFAAVLKNDRQKLLSFICSDLSMVSRYVTVSNSNYRILRDHLPGPYTFILPATSMAPRKLCQRRSEIGIRIPNNATILALVSELGEPIANASLDIPGNERADTDQIMSRHWHDTDIMLDTGILDDPRGSTIVDLTKDLPVLIREGKGEWKE